MSQGFLTRLVTDGEPLTRLDALEVVVQGVLCHIRVRWAVYRVGFAEFHVAPCHVRYRIAEFHVIFAEFQVALCQVLVSLDEYRDSFAEFM